MTETQHVPPARPSLAEIALLAGAVLAAPGADPVEIRIELADEALPHNAWEHDFAAQLEQILPLIEGMEPRRCKPSEYFRTPRHHLRPRRSGQKRSARRPGWL